MPHCSVWGQFASQHTLMSSCMLISIWTEPTPTFGRKPFSVVVEREGWWFERKWLICSLGKKGGMAETGGLSQQHKDGDYTTGARVASYQHSLLAATIRQRRTTRCPFIISTATTVYPPSPPSQCAIQCAPLFCWFTISWLYIRLKKRCGSRWLAVDIVVADVSDKGAPPTL